MIRDCRSKGKGVSGRRRRAATALSVLEPRLTARDAFPAVSTLGWNGVFLSLGATFGSLWKHACNTCPLTSLAARALSRTLDLSLWHQYHGRSPQCSYGEVVTPFEHGIPRTRVLIVDIRQKCDCSPSWIHSRLLQSRCYKRWCRT